MVDQTPEPETRYGPIREYADGELHVRRGIVNKWLYGLYAVLAVWGVYYLVRYWGGLGPGLAPGQ